ncbi:hypothetical protein [Streptomyces sp. NPDC090112]|uniref:hypothetical protein n=1 Tax=Streptomyces sp. NPDC090112 TaxID=3365949 RepID=UPI0038049A9F
MSDEVQVSCEHPPVDAMVLNKMRVDSLIEWLEEDVPGEISELLTAWMFGDQRSLPRGIRNKLKPFLPSLHARI